MSSAAHFFTYPFEDKRWPSKLGTLLLIGLIPGLNLIAWTGYQLSIARHIARGAGDPLPGWDEWPDILIRGLMALVALFIYFLPALLAGIAIGLLSVIGGRDAGTALLAVRCVLALGAFGYSLGAGVLHCAASIRYAQTDQYGSYFAVGARLRDVLNAVDRFGISFITVLLVSGAALLLIGLSAITIIGPLLILTALSVINGALLGAAAQTIRGIRQ